MILVNTDPTVNYIFYRLRARRAFLFGHMKTAADLGEQALEYLRQLTPEEIEAANEQLGLIGVKTCNKTNKETELELRWALLQMLYPPSNV